jgi:hypothetical protein
MANTSWPSLYHYYYTFRSPSVYSVLYTWCVTHVRKKSSKLTWRFKHWHSKVAVVQLWWSLDTSCAHQYGDWRTGFFYEIKSFPQETSQYSIQGLQFASVYSGSVSISFHLFSIDLCTEVKATCQNPERVHVSGSNIWPDHQFTAHSMPRKATRSGQILNILAIQIQVGGISHIVHIVSWRWRRKRKRSLKVIILPLTAQLGQFPFK